jgi:hypothetical protein
MPEGSDAIIAAVASNLVDPFVITGFIVPPVSLTQAAPFPASLWGDSVDCSTGEPEGCDVSVFSKLFPFPVAILIDFVLCELVVSGQIVGLLITMRPADLTY